LASAVADGQTLVSIPKDSFGAILDANTNNLHGTGFVAGHPRRVITCAHVVNSIPGMRYIYAANSGILREAVLETIMPRFDIAV
jgi:hypothetical protein